MPSVAQPRRTYKTGLIIAAVALLGAVGGLYALGDRDMAQERAAAACGPMTYADMEREAQATARATGLSVVEARHGLMAANCR